MTKPVLSLLIIDDNEDDREIYRRLMRSDPEFDWVFFEAETGREGLDYLKNEKIDGVLLDYSMPGNNGVEVLSSLLECRDNIAIVMLTGYGNEEIAVEAMRMGAMDYLKKDGLTASAIQRAMHNAIEIMSFKSRINDQRQELEKFAHILAHDLKEPARSIAQLVTFLQNDLDEKLAGRSVQYFNLINDASERMINLIDTVTSYTLIGANNIEFEDVSLADAVQNAMSNLDVKVQEHKAVIEFNDLPTVRGDLSQLTQLLQNLISNGVKYCEEAVPKITISAENRGDVWIISVKDNGIGMQEKFHRKIFEAFQRLHTASEYKGTGLGLTICRKIVERHEGEIWCTSQEGEGSVFYFSLPKREADVVQRAG